MLEPKRNVNDFGRADLAGFKGALQYLNLSSRISDVNSDIQTLTDRCGKILSCQPQIIIHHRSL